MRWRSAFQYTYFEHRSDLRTNVIFNSCISSVISSLTSTSIRFTLELNSEPALNRITFRFTFNKKSELVQPPSITFSIFLRLKNAPGFPRAFEQFTINQFSFGSLKNRQTHFQNKLTLKLTLAPMIARTTVLIISIESIVAITVNTVPDNVPQAVV